MEQESEVKQMTELEARARWVCCPMCDRKTCCFGASDCDAKRWMIERGEQDDERKNTEADTCDNRDSSPC